MLVVDHYDSDRPQPLRQRQFATRMGATTIEVASNHCAMVSHPDEVAELIETAAQSVLAPVEAAVV